MGLILLTFLGDAISLKAPCSSGSLNLSSLSSVMFLWAPSSLPTGLYIVLILQQDLVI